MIWGKMQKGFWITLGTTVVSFLLMAPADIVEFFSWLPKPILDQIPSSSRVWTFVGLCEIAVGLGDRFYLPLALVLNIFLLFRKQAPSQEASGEGRLRWIRGLSVGRLRRDSQKALLQVDSREASRRGQGYPGHLEGRISRLGRLKSGTSAAHEP